MSQPVSGLSLKKAAKTEVRDLGSCALCNGRDRAVVQHQSLALLNRPTAYEIDFAVCRDCGHLQQWPAVSPELMTRHYTAFATYELHGHPGHLRDAKPSRHARRFLSMVKKIGLKPGQAYEIGCAAGEMLHQFRRQGWQVGGCDPSPSAVLQAQDIFDIKVDLGSEKDVLPRQRGLDLVLLSHVLEHLHEPVETLTRLHRALVSGGYLLLEVPCASAPDVLPPGWFTFEHLHYYQPSILEQMLRQAGFRVLEMRIALNAERYPVMTVAARKTRPIRSRTACDPQTSIMMARTYAKRDAALWASTARKVAGVTGPAFIYGAGIHTAQLLSQTRLRERIEILMIADRDQKKWGQTLAGCAIIGPQELLNDRRDAPVIVSSYASEPAIVGALLEAGMAPSRIRPLYSPPPF